MATKKTSKPHASARRKASASATTSLRPKKVAAKASKAATKAKTSKKKMTRKEREEKELEELTLRIFQWAYESNQRGEFRRL